jgi:hypothetical protein
MPTNTEDLVFEIQEHGSSTRTFPLVIIKFKNNTIIDNASHLELSHLDTAKDAAGFYLEQAPLVEPGDPPRYLFRIYTHKTPTYLVFDRTTMQPKLIPLGSSISSLAMSSEVSAAAIELTEVMVRKRVQMWMEHPRLGRRYVSIFGNSGQLGLSSQRNSMAQFEIRKITEDGYIALVNPGTKRILVSDQSTGIPKMVAVDDRSKAGRKWQFQILRHNGGRIYLDAEDGSRLGAMDDGRLRWRDSWVGKGIDADAISEFYINEIQRIVA